MNTKGTLEIHGADGIVTRHPLEGDDLTIGTGQGADLRLEAGSGLSSAALSLSPSDDGVRVDVAESEPSGVYFAGSEHRSVQVPWGEEVYLGPVRLSFVRSKARRTGSSAVLLVVGLAVVALAGAAGVQAFEPAAPSAREVEAPSLMGGTEICRASDRTAVERRAREAERAARAKRERFAFAASDGVLALRLYREAEDCFGRAERAEDRARVARELATWTGRLNEEYSALRLRLRVALDHGRDAEALAVTTELESLLVGYVDGPYVQWLSALRQELERKSARKAS